jgi:peroxiredoxin (alkyl hydroperoxide reductase subunit C)
MALKVGDKAPDFDLSATGNQKIKLSSFQGKKNVVLIWHPLNFTGPCSNELQQFNKKLADFQKQDTELFSLSIDSLASSEAFYKELGGINYPHLSDFYPHGKVAQDFGILRSEGFSERAVFVIDKQGLIRWAKVYEIKTVPDVSEVLEAVKKL